MYMLRTEFDGMPELDVLKIVMLLDKSKYTNPLSVPIQPVLFGSTAIERTVLLGNAELKSL